MSGADLKQTDKDTGLKVEFTNGDMGTMGSASQGSTSSKKIEKLNVQKQQKHKQKGRRKLNYIKKYVLKLKKDVYFY